MTQPASPLFKSLRLPACLCALSMALAYLLVQPYAEQGIIDDWSYIRSAQVLAQTGHVVYNGWATAMIGWQLYAAAILIKAFGFSFTVARASGLIVAMATAFLVQRSLFRSGLNDWNAALATLTLVLSPLFLPLSFTYMTDVPGTFSVVVCLYACLRAVQARLPMNAALWIGTAAIGSAVTGTARQNAWLGAIVMVPSALWLLRKSRLVLGVGSSTWLLSIAFIAASLHWFNQQPYSVPEALIPGRVDVGALKHLAVNVVRATTELPLFLLPLLLAYVSWLFLHRKEARIPVAVGCLSLTALLAFITIHRHSGQGLEPTLGNFVSIYGLVAGFSLQGNRPVVLTGGIRLTLTALVILGVASLVAVLWTSQRRQHDVPPSGAGSSRLSWPHLNVLVLPFLFAYLALLAPRGAFSSLFDRYLLVPVLFAILYLVRYYQDNLQPRLPRASLAIIGIIALFSVAGTHDAFAMYRARLVAIQQLRNAGLPADTIDGGFEYNAWVQTDRTGHVNEIKIKNPPGIYRTMPTHAPTDTCHPQGDDNFPDLHPRYALSFDPNLCGGEAPFAPVAYRTWLPPYTTTIYVIRYTGAD